MKLKTLRCLLAANAMFSVQAFKVINKTSQNISVGGFGYLRSSIKAFTSKSPRVVEPGKIIDSSYWTDFPFDFMTVTVNQQDYPFDNLTPNTTIIFEEYEQNISYHVHNIIEKKVSDEV